MDDLISRKAAINAVGYYSLHSGDKLLFADAPLKALPSAQPEHGRWIEHHSVRGVYYSCSNCKAEGYGRYCQNCGAKMTYEEDDHDDHL